MRSVTAVFSDESEVELTDVPVCTLCGRDAIEGSEPCCTYPEGALKAFRARLEALCDGRDLSHFEIKEKP